MRSYVDRQVVVKAAIGLMSGWLIVGTSLFADEREAPRKEHAEGQEAGARISLTSEQIAQAGIIVATAGPGTLISTLELPGQIVLNADREVHIVPRIGGTVSEVRKVLGDQVAAGETMAVLESRDLADLNATYLAAEARVSLAQITFQREEVLWRQKISAEQDYLTAKQALAEARIDQRQARQKLQALGLGDAAFASLQKHADNVLTRFEVVAPIAGTVIEKHLTVGEVVDTTQPLFTIADLRTVWVDLSVYPKDLPLVDVGQAVTVAASGTDAKVAGTIAYVQPLASTDTRAVLARVVLDNTDRRWRPGLFVTARVAASETQVAVLIPKVAVQTLATGPVVFVADEQGFEPRPVQLGRSDAESLEIVSGLQPGERYVAANSFMLKSELGKGEAEE